MTQDRGAREHRYVACGAVLAAGNDVLLLLRPSRNEVRLPKGHIEPGETHEQAAVRELSEEAGFIAVVVQADLGEQEVEFDYAGEHIIRTERYFLMSPENGMREPSGPGESEFQPIWLSWEEALTRLSFEAEREWVRRAREHLKTQTYH